MSHREVRQGVHESAACTVCDVRKQGVTNGLHLMYTFPSSYLV